MDYTDSAVSKPLGVDTSDLGSERRSTPRLVKFYAAQRTAQGQTKASIKKCPKSSGSTTKCSAALSHYDLNAPIEIEAEGYEVNVMGGYDKTSTRGILKAVEVNGKYTLSLDGKSLDDDDHDNFSYKALFKEYNQVRRDEHGVIITDGLGVYFYECCKFPGYYICWRGDNSVDCELKAHSALDANHFKWEKKPVPDDEEDSNTKKCHIQYTWLVAHSLNGPLVSPAYLTFREPYDKPSIQTTNPTKFLIHYPGPQINSSSASN